MGRALDFWRKGAQVIPVAGPAPHCLVPTSVPTVCADHYSPVAEVEHPQAQTSWVGTPNIPTTLAATPTILGMVQWKRRCGHWCLVAINNVGAYCLWLLLVTISSCGCTFTVNDFGWYDQVTRARGWAPCAACRPRRPRIPLKPARRQRAPQALSVKSHQALLAMALPTGRTDVHASAPGALCPPSAQAGLRQ